MDQNRNQETNNDLDSLLKEFQTLSEVPKTPEKVEAPVPPVQQTPIAQQQTAPAPPVMPLPNEEKMPQQAVVQQPVPPVSEPVTHPDLDIKLNPEPVNLVPPVEPTNNGGDTTPKSELSTGKNSNLFIIIIFIIIGVFIFFIPKISDFLSNKPGKETRPTATPAVTATATPTPVVKEKKLTCTIPDQNQTEMQTLGVSYIFHYLDNKVTKLQKLDVITYTELDDANKPSYTETQTICNSLATKYAGITGYAVTCEEKGKAFTVKYAYDLVNFINPTEIMTGNTTEKIESPVTYNETVTSVKTKMEALGATCK